MFDNWLNRNETVGMKPWLVILPVLAGASSCVAPRVAVSKLPASQSSALERFLAKHPALSQLVEKDCDPGALQEMRKSFGAGFSPYYREGDFNHDGRRDFAVILKNGDPPVEAPGLADTHRRQYQVTVVVFNGLGNGRYDAVYTEDDTAPLVCFLDVTKERQGRLYFGVLETCQSFVIVPTEGGYRTENGSSTKR